MSIRVLGNYVGTYLNYVGRSSFASRQMLVNLVLRVFDEFKKGQFISSIFCVSNVSGKQYPEK